MNKTNMAIKRLAMKNLKNLILWMVVPSLMFAPACEKKVEDPVGCYTLTIKKEGEILTLTEPYTVDAGRAIHFENCGKADFYACFNGTPGHVWAEFNPSDLTTTGADTQAGGHIDITYLTPGQYTATFVLTNRQVGDPSNAKQVTVDYVITVTEAIEE
jgi:hypothetical protein